MLLQMTWADIAAANFFTWAPMLGIPMNNEKFPKLKALTDRVEASPKIAAYIEKRPKTPF